LTGFLEWQRLGWVSFGWEQAAALSGTHALAWEQVATLWRRVTLEGPPDRKRQ